MLSTAVEIAPPMPMDMPTRADAPCFHCGEPVPAGTDLRVEIEGERQPMCCRGCQAAATLIVGAGLSEFYRHRTVVSPRVEEMPAAVRERLAAWDHPAVRRQFTRERVDGSAESSLMIEKVACPACLWLIERYLAQQPGVLEVGLNYSTRRARVVHSAGVEISGLIRGIERLGYGAQPYDPRRQQQGSDRERRTLLRRLGVALVLGMQVMMVATAFYFDDGYIAADHRQFLNVINLLLTTPVVFYSGTGFLQSAWRGLRGGTLNMDLSVSLGILLAYVGSAWNTLADRGTTYFDAVVMFVTFLLAARYLEFMARARAIESVERMGRHLPLLARRFNPATGGTMEMAAPAELVPGDRLLVRPGEEIPADGVVAEGVSTVNESLLTGESTPVPKEEGAVLIGGSINVDSPLQMTVTRVGENTLLAGIVATLERALGERPRLTALADRIAGWFVGAVLLIAALTALAGIAAHTGHWFANVLAVLVITCPCALSLAAPAAMTCAINALMSRGVLVVRSAAIETAARVTHIVFDKTGTLTHGAPRLAHTALLGSHGAAECLALAAALEQHSEHPIAHAFRAAARGLCVPCAAGVISEPGAGIHGEIGDRRWFLGSPRFIAGHTGLQPLPAAGSGPGPGPIGTTVVLASEDRLVAAYTLLDEIRPEAAAVVRALRARGLRVTLLTGDQQPVSAAVADAVGIEDRRAGMNPEAKLQAVRELQRGGAVVMMIGDGVNDAPVLAGAQVSIAMGGGAALAHSSADMVLLRGDLRGVLLAVEHARKTCRIIRGNLWWALFYNVTGLPAAVLGLVNPLIAAAGMSLSSLFVLGNALRLRSVAEPR
ncbi:MAG: putative copper-importing P-type ATPase A [Gammaproteobacteria bacterium]|nr:putative copper-importing P-type ATPase A [Gammaproteobacteria bacterium]